MKAKLRFVPSVMLTAVAVSSSLSAAIVSYPGMTAAYDVTSGTTQTTGNIALDATYGTFNGAYDWNGGNPIVTTRYYSGTIGTTYSHAGWATSNDVTVNFYLADGTTLAGKIGIPDGGWGEMRAEFPDVSGGGFTMDSVAAPITFNYQIKLTSLEYNKYQIDVFTGAGATEATEGIPAYSASNLNGPYVGSPLSFVRFTTSGAVEGGIASSSNFKSSDAWISAVPEPSAALLGGLGVLALLRRRRA